jgi:putative hydrolase of HD superfamily
MTNRDPSQSVLDFYVLANRLKNTIRSGWKVWHIPSSRVESVAEHIYGAQMLAIAVASEYKINLDLAKVVLMLAIHELGETVIGDITPWDSIAKEQKSKIETEAVEKILSKLALGDKIRELYLEFEQGETEEAKFCGQIDKLEACLQIKLYDEAGFTDYAAPQEGKLEERRKYLWDKGDRTLGKAWINNELELGFYEGEFLELAKYARDHPLLKSSTFGRDGDKE